MVTKCSIWFALFQEEDELIVASCVLRSFDEEAYESPEEEEEEEKKEEEQNKNTSSKPMYKDAVTLKRKPKYRRQQDLVRRK